MKLITDIKTIKRLSTQKENENWQFRRFIKTCDLKTEELDAIVHKLYRQVSKQIDCLLCGNCCRVMNLVLTKNDIKRFTSHLSISSDKFEEKYTDKNEDGELVFRDLPCPFLSGNSCTVYSVRPQGCRSYPHLHKKYFVSRLIGVVSNCSVCPLFSMFMSF